MEKKLDLDNPVTFNEKLQWLKLYNRNPLYTKLVDKYEVREYVANTIGEEFLIPLLGIWDSFEDIEFDKLPDKFVLKATHDSGGVVICTDKKKFDINNAKSILTDSLKRNFYYVGREWPYKNIKPKIICEKYITPKKERTLKDYKFFCFHGEPEYMFVASDRNQNLKFDYYDMEFNKLELRQNHPNSSKIEKKPKQFETMKLLAKKLSKDFPHVRVDFYMVNEKVYFGELTFFHQNGFVEFTPGKWDKIFGKLINLEKINLHGNNRKY